MAREGCAVYLELLIEFPQRKSYKLLWRRTRRFATASSSLSLWKLIETESSSSGDSAMDSTHFSSGLSSASNSPTKPRDSYKLFSWLLSKNRNHQSKTYKTPIIDTTRTPFQIHFHNEKGWSTIIRLTNHLYIICVHLSDHLEIFLPRSHLG